MSNARKPNLFLVGNPKSGTTALYEFFNQHPEVFAPDMKEPNYFSKEFVKERFKSERMLDYFAPTYKKYMSLYEDAGNEKYYLDATPHYLYSKNAAKDIYKFNPNAKIIAVFREPISFLRSWHSELVFGFIEQEEDFMKALIGDLENEDPKTHSFLEYSKWVDYRRQLERYTEVFDNNNIKVVIFKHFKLDNEKVFNELTDFLGVDNNVEVAFDVHNQSRVLRFRFIKKIGENPIIWSNVKKLLPRPIFDLIKKVYIRLIQKNKSREKLEEEKRNRLMKRFFDNVKMFEKLLKKEGFIEKDFSLTNFWGYSLSSENN